MRNAWWIIAVTLFAVPIVAIYRRPAINTSDPDHYAHAMGLGVCWGIAFGMLLRELLP